MSVHRPSVALVCFLLSIGTAMHGARAMESATSRLGVDGGLAVGANISNRNTLFSGSADIRYGFPTHVAGQTSTSAIADIVWIAGTPILPVNNNGVTGYVQIHGTRTLGVVGMLQPIASTDSSGSIGPSALGLEGGFSSAYALGGAYGGSAGAFFGIRGTLGYRNLAGFNAVFRYHTEAGGLFQSGAGFSGQVPGGPGWEADFYEIHAQKTLTDEQDFPGVYVGLRFATPEPRPRLAPGYNLQIIAIDADTQKPVPSAHFAITNSSGDVTRAPLTNPDGLVQLRVRQGFGQSASFHIVGAAPTYGLSSVDAVLSPDVVNQVTIQLSKLTTGISGFVLDSSTHKGIPDVEVILVPEVGPYIIRTTNDNGAYEFTRVPAGTYTLKIHKPGYEDLNRVVGLLGGQTSAINFQTAPHLGTIAGYVLDSQGKAVSGATVTITDSAGMAVDTHQTGAEGNFLYRTQPGTYTIAVSAAGFANNTTSVSVTPDGLSRVNIKLQKSP